MMWYKRAADLLAEGTSFSKYNNLTLEAIFSFKTLINFPFNTRRHIPEDVSIFCIVLQSAPLLWLFKQIEKRNWWGGGYRGTLPFVRAGFGCGWGVELDRKTLRSWKTATVANCVLINETGWRRRRAWRSEYGKVV
jgi:hypothetical protein